MFADLRNGYRVTSDGDVLNPSGRRLSGYIKNGYRFVQLPWARRAAVHVLVIEAFTGPRPKGMQCCHINGVRTDNRAENLRWGTPKENYDDQVRHGSRPLGVKHCRSKLSEREVLDIRAAAAAGAGTRVLSSRYNLNRSTVLQIIRGETWKELTGGGDCRSGVPRVG